MIEYQYKLGMWIPRYTWCEDCRRLDHKSLVAHMNGCPYEKGDCMYPRECPECTGEEE